MILSKIQHENIIKLVGKYRNKKYYNIILEFCNGGDLKNYLKSNGNQLLESVARDIIRQILEAVDYLHS
jgi:calcium-dependent protein kinase